ncbi:MAG: hypothetical protein KAJ51_11295, partial [Thermoplasmata archaeon]|nr:hypothetical protein [Thermoplasmata archaeon]
NDGGLTFSKHKEVDDSLPLADCRVPCITIDQEDIIHVAWSDERNRVGNNQNNSDIRYTKSIDNGISFQSSIQVNDDSTVEWQYVTSITVDKNNNVYVAWEDWRNNNADIYLSVIFCNESSFRPNVRVNNDLGNTIQYWPSIAVNSTGQVFVAWQDGRNGNFDIYISHPKLNLSNLPPVAIIDSPENFAKYYTNEIINFNGTNSYDPENDVLSFYWTSNVSGSIGYTSEFNSTLPIGSHLITLYVDDGHNHNVTATVNISIINRPPKSIIDYPKDQDIFIETENVYFDGFNSTDPDNDILSFYWTSNISGGIGFTPRFNLYLPEGHHLITLFVDDNYGHNITAQVTISIIPLPEPVNLPPTPVIDWPENGTLFRNDRPIYFDGMNSTDPDNDILNFYWSSDYHGHLSSQPKFSTLIEIVGKYKITLSVNDGQGHNVSTSVFIEVHYVPPPNKPPTAIISSPTESQVFQENSTIYFDAMNSTDPEFDELTFRWESNISGELGTQDHFIEQLPIDDHMITLYVYDTYGHASKAYVNISIKPHEPVNDTDPNGSIEIDSPHENDIFFPIIVIVLIVLIIIIALVIILILIKSKKPPPSNANSNSTQGQDIPIEADDQKSNR